MHNKISFFILSSYRSPVKQVSFSRPFIRFICLLVLAGLAFLGLGVHDYLDLKKNAADTRSLEQTISYQHIEIVSQRKQIGDFAKQINALKTKIVLLGDFEKKIRIIANLDNTDEQEGLFGVGGPRPEDLDTSIPLKEPYHGLVREMHEQRQQIQEATIRQEDRFKSLLDYLEGQVSLLASTPAIRPIKGWITAGFGHRKSPFTGMREFHKAMDIAARKGTPIVATADGIVSFAGRKGFLGKVVAIDHGHGMVTRYGHAHKILKKRGDKVKRGETVALVGRTGRTTGPHVHYEILLNGIPVNPKKYILN